MESTPRAASWMLISAAAILGWSVAASEEAIGRPARQPHAQAPAADHQTDPPFPNRGLAIFQQAGCASCHAMQPGEPSFGPNLAGLAQRRDIAEIVQSIREPSAQLAPSYLRLRIVSAETGAVLDGQFVSVELVDSNGRRMTIAASEIDQLQLALSDMPEGLADDLTDREFADLIAFLLTLGDANTPRPAWHASFASTQLF